MLWRRQVFSGLQGTSKLIRKILRCLLFKFLDFYEVLQGLKSVRAGQDEAMDGVGDFHFVKVDQEPNGNIQEFHVGHHS